MIRRGDLFATPDIYAFAHGCNCAGAMGKGIAVAFKKRWPEMYASYRARCKARTFNPGDVYVWRQNDCVVYNLGTQKTWRSKATEDAVRSSVSRMLSLAAEDGVPEIWIPRIGAGLGGLDWALVRALLTELVRESDVNLVVCEDFVPDQPVRR